MNTAAKGRRAEHRSRALLEAAGYTVIRAAASKGDWDLPRFCPWATAPPRSAPGARAGAGGGRGAARLPAPGPRLAAAAPAAGESPSCEPCYAARSWSEPRSESVSDCTILSGGTNIPSQNYDVASLVAVGSIGPPVTSRCQDLVRLEGLGGHVFLLARRGPLTTAQPP